MQRISVCCVLFLSLTVARASEDLTVPEKLQDMSCTVLADGYSGSGTFVVRDKHVFVLTCAHVVEAVKKSKKPVHVSILLRDINREEVGESKFKASIFAYSPAKDGQDICILRVKSGPYLFKGAEFGPDPPLKVTTEVFHVGTFFGKEPQSVISCKVAAVGREDNGYICDQLDSGATKGSSGGGIFTKDGKFVGMLHCGYGSSAVNFYVPIRRMKDWGKTRKLEWFFNQALKVPCEADLKKVKVDD